MNVRKKRGVMIALAAAVILMALVCLFIGSSHMSLGTA